MGSVASAAAALADATLTRAVDVVLDGSRVALALVVDGAEHDRRRSIGAGAVTSTGMLHGLWLLPSGVPVPRFEIPEPKRSRLLSDPAMVSTGPEGMLRLYNPPGVVTAIAVERARSQDALRCARRFPPILDRYITTGAWTEQLLMQAKCFGIGVIQHDHSHPSVVLRPSPREHGVPAVYRWWLAEVAYERWRQLNAQPVS